MDQLPEGTQALVRAAQADEDGAIGSLYSHYWPYVCRIVYLQLGTNILQTAEGDDLAQDALLKAIRDLKSFESRSEASFRWWLSRVVTNTVHEHIRKQNAQKRGSGRVTAAGWSNPIEGRLASDRINPTPSQYAISHETSAQLVTAMASLDERTRNVILMHRECGMSHADIADELGLSCAATSQSILARGLAKVSKHL